LVLADGDWTGWLGREDSNLRMAESALLNQCPHSFQNVSRAVTTTKVESLRGDAPDPRIIGHTSQNRVLRGWPRRKASLSSRYSKVDRRTKVSGYGRIPEKYASVTA
jgi:hypothetical protein